MPRLARRAPARHTFRLFTTMACGSAAAIAGFSVAAFARPAAPARSVAAPPAVIVSVAPAAAPNLLGPGPLAPNDDCATPLQITGPGPFTFDLSHASTGSAGQNAACAGTPEGMRNDLWFCWTATCTGVVTISTCGQTTADTKIVVYDGCNGCPGSSPSAPNPLCCNDDGPQPCGKQSLVTCEVVCGQQYLIQIGNSPNGSPGGSGTFTIDCAGEPCAPPEPPASCCHARPAFLPTTTFPGVIGVQTADRGILTGPGSDVVVMYDLNERPSNVPPIGCTSLGGPDFQATAQWNTAKFVHPTWSKDSLGTVFGVALDDRGHTYVTHTSSYSDQGGGSGDRLGALAGSAVGAGAGAIYKINSTTGVASLFAKLPNNPIVGCLPAPDPLQNECYPGLGNIAFDCDHAQFFVSNFQDGRIYRIRQSDGAILGTFKHGSGLVVSGNTLDPIDTAGFIPITPDSITGRGRRVWAVEPHNNRLYYSVWREDFPAPNLNVTCGRDDPAHDNEIWSIALDSAGAFVPGSETLEVTMPAHVAVPVFNLNSTPFGPNPCFNPSGPPVPYPASCSSPVSDISFDASGCLLAAERSMDGDTDTSAHLSRVIQFCPSAAGGGWTLSPTSTFGTGLRYAPFWVNESNATGGVDVDLGVNGRVWATVDAMSVPFNPSTQQGIYGIQGLPAAGGNVCNSACIDSNAISTSADKFKQGSVAVSCARACSEIEDETLLCVLEPSGGVTWTFTVTNNSGVPAYYMLLTPPIGSGVTFSPNAFPLPPLPSGGSATFTTTITGATPGERLCFDITLLDQTLQVCCTIEHCLDIPTCSCGEVRNETLVCIGGGTYAYSFDLVNLSGMPIQQVYLLPGPASGITFNPNYFGLTGPLPNFGVVSLSTTVTGVPGSTHCFTISIHDDHFVECCSFERCITLPEPCDCTGDINGDGVVDFRDLAMLLANYGQSGPSPCDLNGDGAVTFLDLNILLGVYGGPC